tara:strand:- start:170 stop:385 length:216 start_codon:yes stop_codon:yes gene_type:complete
MGTASRLVFILPFMFILDLAFVVFLAFPTLLIGAIFEIPFMAVNIPVNFMFEMLYYLTNFKFDWMHLGVFR